ncbi:MAG: hypothetical protein ACK5RM_05825, partial [Pseudanabaena sp.]
VLSVSTITYSGFQMSVYSFENKKSVPLRVLSFHFAVGKMKTTILKNFNNVKRLFELVTHLQVFCFEKIFKYGFFPQLI